MLEKGLKDVGGQDASVVATVDDITIISSLNALVNIEKSRSNLQKPAKYLVNEAKQYVYTMNEQHVAEIHNALLEHTVIYKGSQNG